MEETNDPVESAAALVQRRNYLAALQAIALALREPHRRNDASLLLASIYEEQGAYGLARLVRARCGDVDGFEERLADVVRAAEQRVPRMLWLVLGLAALTGGVAAATLAYPGGILPDIVELETGLQMDFVVSAGRPVFVAGLIIGLAGTILIAWSMMARIALRRLRRRAYPATSFTASARECPGCGLLGPPAGPCCVHCGHDPRPPAAASSSRRWLRLALPIFAAGAVLLGVSTLIYQYASSGAVEEGPRRKQESDSAVEVPPGWLGEWRSAGTDSNGTNVKGASSIVVSQDGTYTEKIHGRFPFERTCRIWAITKIAENEYEVEAESWRFMVAKHGERWTWGSAGSSAWYEKSDSQAPTQQDRKITKVDPGMLAAVAGTYTYVGGHPDSPEAYGSRILVITRNGQVVESDLRNPDAGCAAGSIAGVLKTMGSTHMWFVVERLRLAKEEPVLVSTLVPGAGDPDEIQMLVYAEYEYGRAEPRWVAFRAHPVDLMNGQRVVPVADGRFGFFEKL